MKEGGRKTMHLEVRLTQKRLPRTDPQKEGHESRPEVGGKSEATRKIIGIRGSAKKIRDELKSASRHAEYKTAGPKEGEARGWCVSKENTLVHIKKEKKV